MKNGCLINIKENCLKAECFKGGILKEKSVFKIKARKEKLTLSRTRKSHPYFKDKYWKNGGPCPPGQYYLFYRFRKEKGKLRERLELTRRKPEKMVVNEDDTNDLPFLFRQSHLKFKQSVDRTNIQIHQGSESEGCFILSKQKKFYQMVIPFLKVDLPAKVKVDDYWQTFQGRKEKELYRQAKNSI